MTGGVLSIRTFEVSRAMIFGSSGLASASDAVTRNT
jgi:hypothetical protein